ncbi:MAG: hypothetical protein NTY38_20320, partial [Acidobacteria bacterium]|nr:hypothetical protein [Acidobacteriota bacterium]
GVVRITMAVNPEDLVFSEKDGKFTGDIDFFFAPLTAGKETPPAERQPLHLSFTPERYKEFRRADWLVARELLLKPGARSLRVLVLDRTTGATGSITLPVTSPR